MAILPCLSGVVLRAGTLLLPGRETRQFLRLVQKNSSRQGCEMPVFSNEADNRKTGHHRKQQRSHTRCVSPFLSGIYLSPVTKGSRRASCSSQDCHKHGETQGMDWSADNRCAACQNPVPVRLSLCESSPAAQTQPAISKGLVCRSVLCLALTNRSITG